MNLRMLLFSHYSYSGVGGAIGVFVVGAIGYFFGGLSCAASMLIGAVVIHLVETPCPPNMKLKQLGPLILITALITFLTLLSSSGLWHLVCIIFVSFLATQIMSLSPPMASYSFACFYAMIMAMAVNITTKEQLVAYLSNFVIGAVIFTLFATIKEYFLELRSKQQILAVALHNFSRYLIYEAFMFSKPGNIDNKMQIIQKQVKLTWSFQDCRNIIFKNKSKKYGWHLAPTLFALFDAYDDSLSCLTNLHNIQNHTTSAILDDISKLFTKLGKDVNKLALTTIQNQPAKPIGSYDNLLKKIDDAIEHLEQSEVKSNLLELRQQLWNLTNNVKNLSLSMHTYPETLPISDVDLQAFVSPSFFNWSVLKQTLKPNLHFNSQAMRFSLRTTAAMITGFIISIILPYNAHSYWILLTIAVITKINFSQTKKRALERIIGTIIGCFITGYVLYVVHDPWLTFTCLFLSFAIAKAFVTQFYTITAIAATLMGMIQIHLLVPSDSFLIIERLIDTMIGGIIAYGFSYTFQNWEHQNIPNLIANLNKTCLDYAYQTFNQDDMEYRVTRRRFHLALLSLVQTIGNMRSDPKSKQLPLIDLKIATIHGYRIASHIAALKRLIQKNTIDTNDVAKLTLETYQKIAPLLDSKIKAEINILDEDESHLLNFDLLQLEQKLAYIYLEIIEFTNATDKIKNNHKAISDKNIKLSFKG